MDPVPPPTGNGISNEKRSHYGDIQTHYPEQAASNVKPPTLNNRQQQNQYVRNTKSTSSGPVHKHNNAEVSHSDVTSTNSERGVTRVKTR